MARALRRAGARWRILVHGRDDGASYDVTSNPREQTTGATVTLPNTEFDELVVGRWIHLEQMDVGHWWMDIGGVTLLVDADRDGRPRCVQVYGPGDYADPVPGCSYHLVWSGEPERAP